MQWENLTSSDFKKAVMETNVCVVAMGVIEKHGEHLPLGTDFMVGHKIACFAAEKEAAVVFMPFYFGQIFEARCFPGTVAINPTLLFQVIQGVFDEIGRNGFEKIILYNAHGGNWHLLQFLSQCSLFEEKPYSVYLYTGNPEKDVMNIVETKPDHACEWETSVSLAIHSNLVKMDRIPPEPSTPLNRLKDLPYAYTGINWYSNYPEHYAGNAKLASVEKGEALLELHVNALAKFIAAVKADKVVPTLKKEFFERSGRIKG